MKCRNEVPEAHVLGAVLAFALAAAYSPAATWKGLGANTLASNGDNWEGGSAPSTNDAIVLDATGAAYPMTWDLDFPVGSWTQDGYTSTVTIATRYGSTGSGFTNLVVALTGFDIVEEPEARLPRPPERRDAEAAALLHRTGAGARLIVLDETGRALTSAALADQITAWRDQGVGETDFLVGGPDGHGPSVLEKADLVLSLGKLTWPHQLVRVMLAEQLYRIVTLLAGHPYHRA